MNAAHPLHNDSVWAMYYRDGKTLAEIALMINCSEDDLTPQLGAPLERAMEEIGRYAIKEISRRDNTIADHIHTMTEQNKAVKQMADLVKTMSGQKAKEREKAKADAAKRFKFGKNTNYLQSVGLGLREGLWLAPIALFSDMKTPLFSLFGSVLLIVGSLLSWTAGRFVLVCAGFAGRVSPAKERS